MPSTVRSWVAAFVSVFMVEVLMPSYFSFLYDIHKDNYTAFLSYEAKLMTC